MNNLLSTRHLFGKKKQPIRPQKYLKNCSTSPIEILFVKQKAMGKKVNGFYPLKMWVKQAYICATIRLFMSNLIQISQRSCWPNECTWKGCLPIEQNLFTLLALNSHNDSIISRDLFRSLIDPCATPGNTWVLSVNLGIQRVYQWKICPYHRQKIGGHWTGLLY